MKSYGNQLKGGALAALAMVWMTVGVMFHARAADPVPVTPGVSDNVAEPARPPVVEPGETSGATSNRSETGTSRRRWSQEEMVSVGSDATVASNQTSGQVVVVNGDATIEGEVQGDVVVVFGKLKLRGNVTGDVVVVLGEADVDGQINGDTSLIMTRSRFGPRAETRGEVIAVGVRPDVDDGANLRSDPDVVSLGPLLRYFEGTKDYLIQGVLFLRPFPPRVGWVWIAAGVFLVFHLLIALVFARPMGQCMDLVREQPARSFLVGLIACVLVGPVSLLLSFTVIAPFLIWMAFLAVCVFGRVAAYGAVGAAVTRAAGVTGISHPLGAVLIGSLILYASYMIPLVGLLVYGLVLPLGMGAVMIHIFDMLKRERPPTTALPRPNSFAAASALASGSPGPATHGFTARGPAAAGAGTDGGGGVEPPNPPPLPPPPLNSPTGGPQVIPLGGIEALAYPRVGFWPRFAAATIDMILIGVINIMTFQSAESFWFLLASYHGLLWAWKGTTVGGSVLNLRLVRVDGRPMDWQTSIVRLLGAVVSLVPLGLGFFWVSWDAEFQSWHDRIAGTTIVKPDRRVSLV